MSRILSQFNQLGQLFRPSNTVKTGKIPSFQQKPYANMSSDNPFGDEPAENPFRQMSFGQNKPFDKPRFLAYHNTRAIYVGGRLNVSS